MSNHNWLIIVHSIKLTLKMCSRWMKFRTFSFQVDLLMTANCLLIMFLRMCEVFSDDWLIGFRSAMKRNFYAWKRRRRQPLNIPIEWKLSIFRYQFRFRNLINLYQLHRQKAFFITWNLIRAKGASSCCVAQNSGIFKKASKIYGSNLPSFWSVTFHEVNSLNQYRFPLISSFCVRNSEIT